MRWIELVLFIILDLCAQISLKRQSWLEHHCNTLIEFFFFYWKEFVYFVQFNTFFLCNLGSICCGLVNNLTSNLVRRQLNIKSDNTFGMYQRKETNWKHFIIKWNRANCLLIQDELKNKKSVWLKFV